MPVWNALEVEKSYCLERRLFRSILIDIHIDVNELAVAPAENQTTATYDDIKTYVREHSALTFSTLLYTLHGIRVKSGQ